MKRKRKGEKSTLRDHIILIGLLVMMVLIWTAIFYAKVHSKLTPEEATRGSVPTYFRSAGDATPLPVTVDPAKFHSSETREAYQMAKDTPELFAQQPCYCRPDPGMRDHCDRHGHHSLLDCFKTAHAATCAICLKEALLVGSMHRDRKSAQEIRKAIIHGDWVTMGNGGS